MVGEPFTLPAQVANEPLWLNISKNCIQVRHTRPFNLDRSSFFIHLMGTMWVYSLEIGKVWPFPGVQQHINIFIGPPPLKISHHGLNQIWLKFTRTAES